VKLWLSCLGAGVFVLGLAHRAHATEVGRGRDFGLGVALGSPTSLVAKYFVGGGNALDFGLGFWSYGWGCRRRGAAPEVCDNYGAFDLVTANIDYLWQDGIVSGRTAALDWHIGAGGRVWIGDGSFAAAARMPVGVDVTFRKPDFLEVFLEIAPALYIVPGLEIDIEAFLGVRFYF
jgi:hypothetical protein